MQTAVVGSGHWGKRLVRNFHELGALQAVCDTREEILSDLQAQYDGLKVFRTLEEVLRDPGIGALATSGRGRF